MMVFNVLMFLCVWCVAQPTIAQSSNYRKNEEINRDLFPLSLIHVNDMHARYEETNWQTSVCKHNANETCIGGYARIVGTVRTLQRIRPNPIYFNAGDNFAGTIWYTIGRWNITSYLLNLHDADVITLGNHEFDHGVEGVVPFLDTIHAPMVLANVDITDEPTLQGKFKKSIILTRDGRRIGIIGVINRFTYQIAQTGKIRFLNETQVVQEESRRLKEQGVDIIIVLSHCGLSTDYEIAKGGPHVDVIVGSHSHSFLYTGSNPPGPDKPEDEYPVVITQSTGRKVLIVQASCYTKYLGDLTVYFDDAGEVVNWRGAPIFMGPNIEPDKLILAVMEPWKKIFENMTMTVIGHTNSTIDASKCLASECEMGNLLADVYRQDYINRNGPVNESLVVGLVNSGSLRASFEPGDITFGDAVSVQPFGNAYDSADLTGQQLFDMFEYDAEIALCSKPPRDVLQISNLRVTFNASKPVGQRVVSLETGGRHCESGHTQQFEPVNRTQVYRVVGNSFLMNGGDGFNVIKKNKQNHVKGPLDLDMIVDYIKKTKNISARLEGRVTISE